MNILVKRWSSISKNLIRVSILFSLLTFMGCNEDMYEIPIPGYFEIEEFTLQHEDSAIGITDVWVNVDGTLIGVFELPAKFPVIAEGPSEVSLSAGIKVNGINSTRSYYPFYESYTQSIDIKPSEVIKISPATTYANWANIIWEEGFENGHKFEKRESSDTIFVPTDSEKFKGSFSGGVFLNSDRPFFESYTPELVRPDFLGSPGMYLEFNYKCNIHFDVGIYVNYQGNVISTNIISIYNSNKWEKIYIDLYNPLLSYPAGTAYKIYISTWHNASLSESEVYIDEFRIIQSGVKK